jgi:hypothetical protein
MQLIAIMNTTKRIVRMMMFVLSATAMAMVQSHAIMAKWGE